jgi:hypothetical protein
MEVKLQNIEQVKERLTQAYQKALVLMTEKVNRASLLLQSKIVQGLANGTYGIHSRRGAAGLAGSVRVTPAETQGDSVRGSVAGAGGTSWYGKVHEFGGTRSYTIAPVNAKALAWKPFGQSGAVGKQSAFAFTRDVLFARKVIHPPLPQRRWMGEPVSEAKPEVIRILNEIKSEKLF